MTSKTRKKTLPLPFPLTPPIGASTFFFCYWMLSLKLNSLSIKEFVVSITPRNLIETTASATAVSFNSKKLSAVSLATSSLTHDAVLSFPETCFFDLLGCRSHRQCVILLFKFTLWPMFATLIANLKAILRKEPSSANSYKALCDLFDSSFGLACFITLWECVLRTVVRALKSRVCTWKLSVADNVLVWSRKSLKFILAQLN